MLRRSRSRVLLLRHVRLRREVVLRRILRRDVVLRRIACVPLRRVWWRRILLRVVLQSVLRVLRRRLPLE